MKVTSLTKQQIGWVAAGTLLPCFGLFLHNRAAFPQHPLLDPETTIPVLIFLLLFLGWWLLPLKRTMRITLLSWAFLNLVGGSLSVLPLPFLHWNPEQTVFHYLLHLQYALTLIPLIVILLRQARRSANRKGRSGAGMVQ